MINKMETYKARFIKMLRFEAQKGYEDNAVTGGLAHLKQTWLNEGQVEGIPQTTLHQVADLLSRYSDYGPVQRRDAIHGILALLGEKDLPKQPHASLSASKQAVKNEAGLGQVVMTAGEKSPASNPSEGPKATVTAKSASGQVRARIHVHQNSGNLPDALDPVGLSSPVSVIRGIGVKQAKALAKLGVRSIKDLIYLMPRRYEDYSKLKPIGHLFFGEEVTIVAQVQSARIIPTRTGKRLLEAIVSDQTGSLRLLWFNQDWHLRTLKTGVMLSISGKVDTYLGRLVIMQPDYELLDQQQLHTNRIVPIYPLTAAISQKWLRKTVFNALTYWVPKLHDFLPEPVLDQADLIRLDEALRQVHFPDSAESLKAAQSRLAFDEIFLLQLGVLKQKQDWQSLTGAAFTVSDDWLSEQEKALPFTLTQAQQNAVGDIRSDLAKTRPMNRLLQGDVGSGKTAVAALGMLMVIQSGAQAALMAPTSILAEQHARTLARMLTGSQNAQSGLLKPEEIGLLTGDTKKADRKKLLNGLADGSLKLLIGTHALIEDPVLFKNLQMVVVDEQHRFGVEQRAALRQKGRNPHLLVMTATPIPRSLQLTVFGDLDVSVMDQMPLGRKPISTTVLLPSAREQAYQLINAQIRAGRQAFIIYPLVEQGENEEAKAAVEEYQRLSREVFPDLRVGLVHGRLKPAEKDAVMLAFRKKEYDILVSTSVVEVGVDVPNATVMVVEGADRFGLAQLHQFRGRVGRGSDQSYCLLIPSTDDAAENARLAVMAQTNDGFVLAEKDLEQRGPGDFLGTRQAGFADLQMANLADVKLIARARKIAEDLFKTDPQLQLPVNQLLKKAMDDFWPGMSRKGDMS